MLSPEVEKFPAPNVLIDYNEGSFNGNDNFLENIVDCHYYNHMVSVVIPDAGTSSLLRSLSEVLTEDCEYYRGEGINVKELINKDFIEAFVKKGTLSILSDKTHIDVDDCMALTPSGHLVLTLGRKSYQELGLEGTKSSFTQRHPTTFEEGICPSSVAAYFASRGHKVSSCQSHFVKRLDYNVSVPFIDKSKGCEPSALLEWLGAYSIGADLVSGSPDDFVNTYQPPEESRLLGQVLYLQWTGFFFCSDVQRLLVALRNFLSVRDDIPWVSMYVQGFWDSPVSWALKEHQYYTSGENDYVIVIKPGGDFSSFSILASNKRPCRKLSSKKGR